MLFVIERRPSDVFQEDRTNSVTIGVADEHIGLVVGRGGRNIMEISQVFILQMIHIILDYYYYYHYHHYYYYYY
jgi:hypothetical protein